MRQLFNEEPVGHRLIWTQNEKRPWYKLFLRCHLWNLIISQFISISYFYFTALNLAFSFCFFLAETTRNWKKNSNDNPIQSHLTVLLPICDKSTKSRTNSSPNICALGCFVPRQTDSWTRAFTRQVAKKQWSPCHTHMSAGAPWSPACSPPSILWVLTRSMFQPGGGWVGPSRCRALNFSIIF